MYKAKVKQENKAKVRKSYSAKHVHQLLQGLFLDCLKKLCPIKNTFAYLPPSDRIKRLVETIKDPLTLQVIKSIVAEIEDFGNTQTPLETLQFRLRNADHIDKTGQVLAS